MLAAIYSNNSLGSQSKEDEQPTVTWKTFQDRNGLFSVQYPSNWTASSILESMRVGPIDILFLSPGANPDTGAEVNFVQYADPSLFITAQVALEAAISTLQNNQTLTEFEIVRPIECSMYTISGVQACSVIYEIRSPDLDVATMVVDALATDGTEYQVFYKSDFDSFEHFLPIVESMIRSFQLTSSEPADTDFSLSNGPLASLDPNTTNAK